MEWDAGVLYTIKKSCNTLLTFSLFSRSRNSSRSDMNEHNCPPNPNRAFDGDGDDDDKN